MAVYLDDEQVLQDDVGDVHSYLSEHSLHPLPYSQAPSAIYRSQDNALPPFRQPHAANHRQPLLYSPPLLDANGIIDYVLPSETILDDYGMFTSRDSIRADQFETELCLQNQPIDRIASMRIYPAQDTKAGSHCLATWRLPFPKPQCSSRHYGNVNSRVVGSMD